MRRRVLSFLLVMTVLTGCDGTTPASPAPSATIGDTQRLNGSGGQVDVTLLAFLDPAPPPASKRRPGHRAVAIQLLITNTGAMDARLQSLVHFSPTANGTTDDFFAEYPQLGEPNGAGADLPEEHTLAKGTRALGYVLGQVPNNVRIATVFYSTLGIRAGELRWDVTGRRGTVRASASPAPAATGPEPLALGTPAELAGKSVDLDPTDIRLSVTVTKFEHREINASIWLTARNTGGTEYKTKDRTIDYRRVSLSNDLGETVVQPAGFGTEVDDPERLPAGAQQTWLIPFILPAHFVPTSVQFAGVDNGAVRWALPR